MSRNLRTTDIYKNEIKMKKSVTKILNDLL